MDKKDQLAKSANLAALIRYLKAAENKAEELQTTILQKPDDATKITTATIKLRDALEECNKMVLVLRILE